MLKKLIKLIETLSFLCVISYFFLHSIIFVLFGICLSLLAINKSFNNNMKTLLRELESEEEIISALDLEVEKSKDSMLKQNSSNLRLVEEIEELGFIPSIKRNKEDKIA